MPQARKPVSKHPKWNLNNVPSGVKPSIILFLKVVERAVSVTIKKEKNNWQQEHGFKPTSTTFWDGKIKISQDVELEAQKKIWISTHTEKIKYIQ